MTELIIGRESGADAPRLAVEKGGLVLYLGKAGSVPKSVSRRHCRLAVYDKSRIEVEDLTQNNFLFVNGIECKRKDNVTSSDILELGPDRYKVDLDQLFKLLASKQSYNVSYLGVIYDEYQNTKLNMQVSQGKMSVLSALPGSLSTVSIGLAVFIPSLRAPMSVAAAVFAILFGYLRFVNAGRQPMKVKKIEDEFREKYVCPNPGCHHFLGSTPYRELIKGRACPYCKAKFTEE